MPTIKQLPAATSVAASDLLPLSQGGTTKALAVGSLLSSVQTAISVPASKLLGRVSGTAGAPEVVGIGTGLTIAAGSILATGADHTQLPISSALQAGDEVIVNNSGVAKRMQATSLRSLFAAGSGITIDGAGTIAATGGAGFAGVSTFNSRSGPITLTSADLTAAGGALAANLPAGATGLPLPNGTAAAGSSLLYARQDHIHPTDGTRLGTNNNLSDLTDRAGARSNLGLGGAAVLNVGAAAGTVAAGDDSRIIGAQPAATIGAASLTTTGTTTARAFAERFADRVSVKDFGAVGDGLADDTAAIDAAVAAIAAATSVAGTSIGRTVYFPAGRYNYAGSMALSSGGIEGESSAAAVLNFTAASGVGITLSGYSPRIADIALTASGARAAGSGEVVLLSPSTYHATIERVIVSGSWADHGIICDHSNTTHIRSVDFETPASGVNTTTGAAILVTNTAIETYIDAVNTKNWNIGLRLNNGSGIYVSRCDFVEAVHGVQFDPSFETVAGGVAAPDSVFGAFFTQVLCDTCTSDCWLFTGDGDITDVVIGMSWASSSPGQTVSGSVSGSGMRVDNPRLNGLTLTGVHCLNNFQHGLELLQGKNIGIVNCQVTDNSMSGSGQYDGIYVALAVDQVRIIGCLIGLGGTVASDLPFLSHPNWQRYGINAVNMAVEDGRSLTIVGNQLPGNVTGALSMPTGAGIVQVGNSDQNGLIAGGFAPLSNPTFAGSVEITGSGTALNASLRVSDGYFQVCGGDNSEVLLNLSQSGDLQVTSSISTGTSINFQTNGVLGWQISGGDVFTWSAFDPSGTLLGTVLSVNRATQVVTFNQTPTAPTAALGTNTTQIPTTEFVSAAVLGTGKLVTSEVAYAMQPSDKALVIKKPNGSPTAITLPASPASWTPYVIKDGKGDASINNITIAGSAMIDNNNSFIIDQDYESVTLIFTGVDWSII